MGARRRQVRGWSGASLGATPADPPAFAKCVAVPANSGHRDAAATGSAGRGVFCAHQATHQAQIAYFVTKLWVLALKGSVSGKYPARGSAG